MRAERGQHRDIRQGGSRPVTRVTQCHTPVTCHTLVTCHTPVTCQVTSSPGACQAKCAGRAECHWFTHFDTFCYLLDHCGALTK